MKRLLSIISILALTACTSIQNPDKGHQLDPSTAINLSEKETANCYIVDKPGTYKFRADIKGNGDDYPVPGNRSGKSEIKGGTTAEVLWESFGTSKRPEIVGVLLSQPIIDLA